VISQYTDAKFHPALDTLNQLGATPWVVNAPVLEVALEVFRAKTGDAKLAIPADVSTLPVAPKFSRRKLSTEDGRLEFAQVSFLDRS